MTLPFKPAAVVLGYFLLSLSITATATGANIDLSRFAEVGVSVTDNPELDRQNTQTELVFNIKPSVELKFSGNRFGAIALGEVEYYRFNEAKDDLIDPRLFSRVRGALINNLLFLDTTLTISKLLPDRTFIRLSDDSDPVAAAKVKTFIDKSYGQFADLYMAYRFSTLAATKDSLFDSTQNNLEFSFGRNPRLGGIIWGVGGFYDIDESAQNEFENASAYGKLGSPISRTVLAEFTAGIESREFIFATDTANPTTTENDDTPLWNAALTWSPSERTSLIAGYGERFFGAGPNLQLKHRVQNSNLFASYIRDVSRTEATLNGIAPLTNNTGINLVAADTNNVTIDGGGLVTPLDEPFVDHQLRLAYKLAGRRSDIIFDTVYSRQEQLAGNDVIKSLLSRLVFDRKLSDLTTIRLQYDYQKSKAPNRPNRNYTENRFAVKIIYNFDKVDKFRDDEFTID